MINATFARFQKRKFNIKLTFRDMGVKKLEMMIQTVLIHRTLTMKVHR